MKYFITLCYSGIIAALLLTSCSKDPDSDKNEDNQNVKMSRLSFYSSDNPSDNFSDMFFYDDDNRLVSKSRLISKSKDADDSSGSLIQFYYQNDNKPVSWMESWAGETSLTYLSDTLLVISGSDTLKISHTSDWISGNIHNETETILVEFLTDDKGQVIYSYMKHKSNFYYSWSMLEDSLTWDNGNCTRIARYYCDNHDNTFRKLTETLYEYDAKTNYVKAQHWPMEYIYAKMLGKTYDLNLLVSYLNKNNALLKTVISEYSSTKVYQHNFTSYSGEGFPLKEKNLSDSTVFEYH